MLTFQKYGYIFKIRQEANDQLMILMDGVELCRGFVDNGETTFYAYGTDRTDADTKIAALEMIDLLV